MEEYFFDTEKLYKIALRLKIAWEERIKYKELLINKNENNTYLQEKYNEQKKNYLQGLKEFDAFLKEYIMNK